jgi:hypothetical protein
MMRVELILFFLIFKIYLNIVIFLIFSNEKNYVEINLI